MEQHLHSIDQMVIDEYITVNKERVTEELDQAGVNYVIQQVPVVLVATSEGEYTIAKTINTKNLLRLAIKSSEKLVDQYEAEGIPEIIEIGRE